MSIMAKTPSGYKKIGSAYLGERPVDKVFNANGDVVYALQRELTGVPPLLFKGKEQSELLNYRIYGDTVDGESVGDRTGNLFNKSGSQYGNNLHWVPARGLVYSDTHYGSPIMDVTGLNTITRSYTGTGANYFLTPDLSQFVNVSNIGTVDAGVTVNVPDGYTKYVFNIPNTMRPDSIMVNSGSTALPYEPYGYKVPVTVEGKNLFNENSLISPILVRDHYLSWYFDDEHYLLATDKSIDDRPWSYDYSQIHIALSSGTYTIRLSGVATSNQFAGIYITNSNNDRICSENISGKTSSVMTFTLNTPETIGIEIKVFDGKYRIMLVEGSTPLSYEPYQPPVTTPIYLPEPIKMVGDEAEYVDYAEQKMHRVRKNLLPNTATSQTINGVTFTVNSDGSVTCNGTCVSNVAYFHIKNKFKFDDETIRYTLTGCPRGGEYRSTYTLEYSNAVNQARTDSGNGVSFAPYSAVDYPNAWVRIIIFLGYTCNNLTFYPMIRKADIEDDTYEPYIEDTDLDVILPALPTVTGTNTMSVDTEVQPSRMDIEGRIKSLT